MRLAKENNQRRKLKDDKKSVTAVTVDPEIVVKKLSALIQKPSSQAIASHIMRSASMSSNIRSAARDTRTRAKNVVLDREEGDSLTMNATSFALARKHERESTRRRKSLRLLNKQLSNHDHKAEETKLSVNMRAEAPTCDNSVEESSSMDYSVHNAPYPEPNEYLEMDSEDEVGGIKERLHLRKNISHVSQSHTKKKKRQVSIKEFPSPILNSRKSSSMKNVYATSHRYMYDSLN